MIGEGKMSCRQEGREEHFCRRCGHPMTRLYPLEGRGLRQVWYCTRCLVCRIVRLEIEAGSPPGPRTVASRLAS